ncbi:MULTISPECIES: SIMPL domain-containing protein [unclassified Thauera]|uniref:SIMPL domain-containing protein n=1 Tax=unclassified Thauera TaxID=2609274 RepID=UPI0002CF5449|nr:MULTISPECIES: SIMPL domain-containing protein [unclassified Thauera]ENO93560.1 cyclic nucleotide-binding protein [Thauera sp. 28]WBL62961.1 SIMPL domain-containing protein [Thauera sp. WB-2]HNR62433.1 SIMPL domain-containing protein [Thauera sp.]HNS91753.1 SIMPL domain-containing protein [Thauera sp.]HRK09515.1 SIMPL domain-containing protein [Thauera sp.]
MRPSPLSPSGHIAAPARPVAVRPASLPELARLALGGLLAATLTLAGTAALASEADGAGRAQIIEFSAEASQPAANDLAVAVLYAEHHGPNPGAVAREVNRHIAAALQTASAHADVTSKSGNVSTWPVYAKDGQGRIESWRMRSEIHLESRNLGAMSELVGTLQGSLALSQLSMQPAPDTRMAAVDEATVAALRAFERRAALIANSFGKRYRIASLSIGDSGHYPPVMPRMRAAAMLADAAPAPMEGGESLVSINVNGKIELLD